MVDEKRGDLSTFYVEVAQLYTRNVRRVLRANLGRLIVHYREVVNPCGNRDVLDALLA